MAKRIDQRLLLGALRFTSKTHGRGIPEDVSQGGLMRSVPIQSSTLHLLTLSKG